MISINNLTRRIAAFGVLAVAAAVTLSGCTNRIVDYTLLSTKNVDLSKAGTFKRGPNRITGEDGRWIFIFIPLGAAPHLKQAVDRAIESVPGAVSLVDGVVSSRNWWFILGEDAIVVEGTPLIDPSLPGAQASLQSGHMVSFSDPSTGKQEVRPLDKAAYQQLEGMIQSHDEAGISKFLVALR